MRFLPLKRSLFLKTFHIPLTAPKEDAGRATERSVKIKWRLHYFQNQNHPFLVWHQVRELIQSLKHDAACLYKHRFLSELLMFPKILVLLDASIKIRKMEKEDILSATQTRGGKKRDPSSYQQIQNMLNLLLSKKKKKETFTG